MECSPCLSKYGDSGNKKCSLISIPIALWHGVGRAIFDYCYVNQRSLLTTSLGCFERNCTYSFNGSVTEVICTRSTKTTDFSERFNVSLKRETLNYSCAANLSCTTKYWKCSIHWNVKHWITAVQQILAALKVFNSLKRETLNYSCAANLSCTESVQFIETWNIELQLCSKS